jgi:hypothetical protein
MEQKSLLRQTALIVGATSDVEALDQQGPRYAVGHGDERRIGRLEAR